MTPHEDVRMRRLRRNTGLIVFLLVLWLPMVAYAVQFGAGTGSDYPTSLDTTRTYTNKGGGTCSPSDTTKLCSELMNDLQSAIVAIQTSMGTGTLYSTAHTWSILQTFTASPGIDLNGTAPSFSLTDTTASAKSLTIAVDANLAQLRESAGASGSLMVLDLANKRVGIGTAAPSGKFHVVDSPNFFKYDTGLIDLSDGTNSGFFSARPASGERPAGIGLAGSSGYSAFIRGGGSVGDKAALVYYNGSTYYSAVEVASVASGFSNVLLMKSGGNVAIGHTSPDRLFHPELADAVTAAVSYVQRVSHISSGTVAAGFGAGLEWELENASGTNRVVGTLETLFTDATDTSEDADFVVKLMAAGAAAAEKLRVDSTGLLITQNATLMKSAVTLTDGAGVGVGTLTNAPAAGNPTKWVAINDNGTTRYIPAW